MTRQYLKILCRTSWRLVGHIESSFGFVLVLGVPPRGRFVFIVIVVVVLNMKQTTVEWHPSYHSTDRRA